MRDFNVSEFLGNLEVNNGLAKPAKFQVDIVLPSVMLGSFDTNDSRKLSLQCEAAELPGKNFVTEDVKIYGPTYKIPFQTQYNDISLTFLCSGNFHEKFLFDKWLSLIMPTGSNNLRFPKGDNQTGYLTEIYIRQYDDIGNEIYKVNLIDAFPINMQAQTLNWSEDGFHRLTVVFSYLRYETIRMSVEAGKDYVSDDNGSIHPAVVAEEQRAAEALRAGGVAAFGVPINYQGGGDKGKESSNPGIVGEDYTSDDTFNTEPERAGGYVATDYLGGHDGGDNNQGQKAGRPYAGGGVLSGLVRALALGVVANAIAGARSNRGGDRPPPVGRNYAGSDPSTPPGGKPYGS